VRDRGQGGRRIDDHLHRLTRDAHRLEAAKRLGADHIVMVDQEPLTDAVERITKGAGVDLVIDVSSGGASEVIGGALKALKSAANCSRPRTRKNR